MYDILFFINSILLGVGLAMDAFSVSISNGIAEPDMKAGRRNLIAGTYAFFQFIMPLIGWVCMHTLTEHFSALEKITPVIALILLIFIGGKMVIEGISDRIKSAGDKDNEANSENTSTEKAVVITVQMLILQGIATSIDALSVGVTFANYSFMMAFIAALIIAVVTHVICILGLHIGKRVGAHFSEKATIIGGCILILIGLEIFIRGMFF